MGSSWNPNPDRDAAAALGDALRSVGYTSEAIEELLGEDGPSADLAESVVFARRLPRSAIATTVKLLLLQRPAPVADVTAALGAAAVNALRVLGLVTVENDALAPRARIVPSEGLLLVFAFCVIASNFVMAHGFARLSIDDEIVIEPKKPMVTFGGVAVAIPPGAFLQATEAAEQAMADIVGGHLKRAKKVADLFAGCGSFALRLAMKSEVHAVEGDAAALSALDRGSRFATGLKRVTGERRDLFRRPLTFKELNAFDGVVFDPPRAGAEDQSKQIARSDVPYVAAVSCNPVTLARDLRILIDGGYTLKSVTPIDQFLWSPHVEAVALLEKPKKRR